MTPACLRELGLDTDATERDIKRAYAAKLKGIDPETHPGDFARLREAFEEARAWASHGAGIDTPTDHAVKEPIAEADVDIHAPPPQTVLAVSTATTDAATAMGTLRAALSAEPDVPAAHLLARVMAFLSTRQLDARAIFEGMLADAIASQQIIRRAGLFAAASETFTWTQTDPGIHDAARGAWIERAIASTANWEAFPEKRRKVLRPWLKQAAREGSSPVLATIHAWPRIGAIMPYAGEYVRLHVDDAILAQWKQSFEALKPGERGKYREAAWDPRQPDIPTWRRVWNRISGSWWWWVLIAKALLIAFQAVRR